MRFDDSLKTVLAGGTASGAGAQAVWRQLVDLMGRGRIATNRFSIARLRLLRQAIPLPVRMASARALADADPDAALVAFFAEDVLAVASPVLRRAILPAADWLSILSRLSPETRSILRHRRDLPADVVRGLEAFGSTDFVLDHDGSDAEDAWSALDDLDAIGDVEPEPSAAPRPAVSDADPQDVATTESYPIADLVARIDAFNRDRAATNPTPVEQAPGTSFRYETDAAGVIRLVEGVSRGPLIGVSLAHVALQGVVRIDAAISSAWHRRERVVDARLDVGGSSDAAGAWRISGAPRFDPGTGRFVGMFGVARRPRVDEDAAAFASRRDGDLIRELVHELRTPTSAIAGFAELIDLQLLGPIAPNYREHAGVIRDQAAALLAAIEDLDTIARIDAKALELRQVTLPLTPLLAGVAEQLRPLATLRGTSLLIDHTVEADLFADERAAQRLFSRLLAALLASAEPSETIAIDVVAEREGEVAVVMTRPAAFVWNSVRTPPEDFDGTPLLGIDFTVRLAGKLAAELGGRLAIADRTVTLHLPLAAAASVDRSPD